MLRAKVEAAGEDSTGVTEDEVEATETGRAKVVEDITEVLRITRR